MSCDIEPSGSIRNYEFIDQMSYCHRLSTCFTVHSRNTSLHPRVSLHVIRCREMLRRVIFVCSLFAFCVSYVHRSCVNKVGRRLNGMKDILLRTPSVFVYTVRVYRLASNETWTQVWQEVVRLRELGKGGRETGPVTRITLQPMIVIAVGGLDHIHCASCSERPGLGTRTVSLQILCWIIRCIWQLITLLLIDINYNQPIN
jgi:hypothetical protein